MKHTKLCLYCNSEVKKKSREHVFPAKFGCPDSLINRSVCEKCNNEVLSGLDTELIDRSPITLINAFANKSGEPSMFWTEEDNNRNLLVECHLDISEGTIYTCPQLIFRDGQFEIRVDHRDISNNGKDYLKTTLVDVALKCLFKRDGKRFLNKRIEASRLAEPYSFPPRAFARNVQDLRRGNSLHLRFLEQENELFMDALREGKLTTQGGLQKIRMEPISTQARWVLRHSRYHLSRAILKVALNAIEFACEKTEVNYSNLSMPVDYIMGNDTAPTNRLRSGFIKSDDVFQLQCKNSQHVIILDHSRGFWNFSMGLFGNRFAIGASIPGPCEESWGSIKITVEIFQGKFFVEKFIGNSPLAGKPTWDLSELLSFLDIRELETVYVENH